MTSSTTNAYQLEVLAVERIAISIREETCANIRVTPFAFSRNESWLFYLNGQMLSDLNHKCVTAHSDGTISLETCIGDNTPSQTWAYDQNSQQLTHNGMVSASETNSSKKLINFLVS